MHYWECNGREDKQKKKGKAKTFIDDLDLDICLRLVTSYNE